MRNGADINVQNDRGCTPLYYAGFNSDKSMVAFLLKEGASPSLSLLLAARSAHEIDFMEFFLDYGANINVKSTDGYTPLHFACKRGNPEAVKFLLDKGANPLVKNKDGKTPRELAKNCDIKEFLKTAEKEYQKWQAFTSGLTAGSLTAVLGVAIAVTLFATGTIVIELIPIVIAVLVLATAALAIGGITYSLLKPSAEVNETKKAETLGNTQKMLTRV